MSSASVSPERRPHPPTREQRAVAELLDALATEGGVGLDEIARLAHLGEAERLQSCRECREHLPPEERMRLAAAAAILSPQHSRMAHNVYGQAQAELRFVTREIRSERPAPESGRRTDQSLADDAASTRSDAMVNAANLAERAAAAQARTRVLLEAQGRLLEAVRAGFAQGQLLRSSNIDLSMEVRRFARTARIIEEPPERALAAMKAVLRPVLSGAGDRRDEILSQAVNWFVAEYYAA